MIEFNTVNNVGGTVPVATHGIKFRSGATGQEALVTVYDKYPAMGDVHVEGRRYVEVSIEAFIEMMGTLGFDPVLPDEAVE